LPELTLPGTYGLLRAALIWRATKRKRLSMTSDTLDLVRVVDEQTAIMLTGV
jgi:hypothetical protein